MILVADRRWASVVCCSEGLRDIVLYNHVSKSWPRIVRMHLICIYLVALSSYKTSVLQPLWQTEFSGGTDEWALASLWAR